MKTKTFFEQMVLSCLSTLALFLTMCVISCSSEIEPVDSSTAKNSSNTRTGSDVTFTIRNENGGGTGTTGTPVKVTPGKKLSMTISQKSSYTDSDGTVFECEPKATIQLSAVKDTVFVENKDQLTTVEKDSDVKTSQDGTNPVCNVIAQEFAVGGQSIEFDLAYEVYSYINKANETIEMPYVKLGQANFSSADANTGGASGDSTTSIRPIYMTAKPAVTLRELSGNAAQTRATKTDTTLYEVNVLFNLAIESVNAQTAEKQTIDFSVNYVGAVINTTEILDQVVLDSVVYKTGAFWEEAHDNLPLLYYPYVQRIKYYSNDSTDVVNFRETGHRIELDTGTKLSSAGDSYPRIAEFNEKIEYISETGKPYYKTVHDSVILNKREKIFNDSIVRIIHSMVVPDLTKVYTKEEDYKEDDDILPGDYNNYTRSFIGENFYNDNETYALTEEEKKKIIGDWADDTRTDGWYRGSIISGKDLEIRYKRLISADTYEGKLLETLIIAPGYHDMFLIIDGKRITLPNAYEEERNVEITDVNDENGIGKKIVYECRIKSFGRNFYIGIEETVYQRQ